MTGLLSGLDRRDAEAVLAQAGLAPTHRDGPLRTPIADYARLYNAVVARLGDEGFGLFRLALRPGTFEFLCRSAIGSPTLGVALERAARFLDVVLPDLAVSVTTEGDTARIEIVERRRLTPRTNDPRRVFAFEWLLRLLHGLGCWLAGRSLTLRQVSFPYSRPDHASDYARVYTAHSDFGAATLIATLDAALLDQPVRRGQDDLASFLEGAPGKIAMLYRRDREVAIAVREILAASLADPPGLAEIAQSLHLSARSLHRRLAGEGTSLRQLKEALRRERAIQALETTTQSVAALAADLGYSEPSAFFRAFVAWTGASPTAWRRRRTTPATLARMKPTRPETAANGASARRLEDRR